MAGESGSGSRSGGANGNETEEKNANNDIHNEYPL
jgi:hypothetical protein